MTALRDALAGRSVLVTGHTGFKGSWLALWLHRLGTRVAGYALPPPTEPNNFELSDVRHVLTRHDAADVRDAARLAEAVRESEPDVVFHLAAQALVRAGYATPRETFDVNTLGVASVLDAVRAAGRPCTVIVVTSDKCYETVPTGAALRESDRLGGDDPYSASKGAAELVVHAYRRSFFPPERLADHGVKLASARAGNVIGGGDWAADRIMTDIVRHLAAGKPVPVRNPRAVRPWQHVLEPLHGYLTLAARMLTSDDPQWCAAWNFGPPAGTDATVAQLVDTFIAAWGRGQWEDAGDARQPPETATLRLDATKAATQLGWQARWDLEEAVRRTAAWYRRFYVEHERDLRAACLADIAAYEAAVPEARP